MILPNDGDGVVTDGDGEPDGDGVPDGEGVVPDGDGVVPDGDGVVPDGDGVVPDGDGMVTDGTVFDGGAAGGVAPPWIDGGGVCPITATTSLGP